MLLKLSVNGLLAVKLKVIKNITLFNNAFIKTLSDKLGMKGCNAVMNSNQAHTSFWCAVRTRTNTELWRSLDVLTRTTPTTQKINILCKNFKKK